MKSLTSIVYKALIALMVVMLALTALPVSPAFAAVSTQQAWSQVYRGAAFPGTYSYTVNAGTNRMLVVGVSSSTTANATQTVTVTYGGQALTQQVGDGTTNARQHTYLFYLKDTPAVMTGTAQNLIVTVTGGTAYFNYVYAGVYAGVDQSATPITNSRNYTSGTGTTGTVVFGTALTVNAGDQAVEMVNLMSSSSTTIRTIDTFAANWSTPFTPTGNSSGGTSANAYVITRTQPGANTTDTSSHDLSSNNTWASMSGMSIKAFPLTPSTTTITSDLPDPSVVGQNVVVNFTVTAGATGNVTVSDGINSCTGTVATGTCTIALSTAGARTLTATYAGNATFAGSTSAGVAHTVNKADTTTTINNAVALGTASVVGQAYAVTYSVAAVAPGAGTPTGNVTVTDGVATCTATVAAGTCNLTSTSVGAKTITATYTTGDANFNASLASAGVPHTVNKANTTTNITGDAPDASLSGQNVVVNFTVAAVGPGAGTRTGNVTVTDNVDLLATCTGAINAAGTGTCTLALTTPGSHVLTATYSGDANFNGSADTENHTVTTTYTITLVTGAGGTIQSPYGTVVTGSVTVASGSSPTFYFVPNLNNIVAGVIQDLNPVGTLNAFQFNNVTASHTLSVTFDGGWYDPAGNINSATSPWANNPINGYNSNNQWTTASTFNSQIVDYTTFDIPTIPTGSAIDGIEVAVEGYTGGRQITASLSGNNGGSFTANQPTNITANNPPNGSNSAEETSVLGGAIDSWGGSWIPGNIATSSFTNSNFRVRITSVSGGLTTFSLDAVQVKVHYRQPTTLTVNTATGIYGGTTTLTAHLATTVGNTPVSGQTINFFLNNNPATPIGSAVTDVNGVATLNNVSLAGINAGAYPGVLNATGVEARYAGTIAGVLPGYLASTPVANTLTVTPATVVPSITADDKPYDGTTAATIATRTLTGVLGTDVVTLTGGTANFADPNVGTWTVTATGLTLSGADAGNYQLSTTTATDTADITAKILTPNITASDKPYDSTTAATILTRTLTGVVGTEDVTLTGGTANFADPNVGTWTVTATGLTLSGAAAGNYQLSSTTATDTADITAAVLTPSITANNKPYDGTTAATIATRTLTGVLGTEDVTLTGGTANFADPNVGTWTVTATGLTLSGADAGNYQLSTTTATTTANITAKILTPNITADNKPYDGTTAATIATRTLIGVVGTEDVILTGGTATFADPNVGTWTVTATGLALSGADAGNYQLSTTTATDTADITAKILTPSITASDKVYDGTTAATILTRTLSGVVGAEDVTLTGGTANFADPNVGTWTVTATGLTLSGADAGNYQLSTTTATDTADITAATLTPNITANDKPYDGTTAATIATRTLTGVLGAEDVTLTGGTANFADPNVGTWTVTATGLTLSGADAGNYQLSTTTATDTADITAKILTPSITADDKPYDGTTAATIATRTLTGVIGAEDVTLTGGTANFANAIVGNWTVTATGLALSGADAGNYQLSTTTATTTANITAASILIPSITADNKIYDGTTAATIATRTLTGVIGTDDVTLTGGTAIFADPNVGNWTVTATGLTLSGADAGNYQLSTTTATTTADITVATVAPNITANDKVYDGTTAATIATRTLTGVIGLDNVALTGGTATFADPNVGTWLVTATGLTLSGTNAGNYQLSTTTATDTADITVATATISITSGSPFTFDGAPHGVTGFAYGVGGIGDVLTPAVTFSYSGTAYGPTATPPTDVETYTVTVSFAGNANYAPASDTANIIINPVGVTVDVTGGTFAFDGNPHAATGFAYGVGGIGDVQTPAVTFTYVGTGPTVYPSSAIAPTNAGTYNATASFAGNVNYSPASNIAAITITKRPIEFTAVTDTKPYDGNTSSSGVPTLTAGTLVGSDNFTLTQSFDTKDAGTGKDLIPLAVISVGNANNYAITYVNNATGVITGIPLTISGATANSRVYDGTTDTTINAGAATLNGVLGSDVVTLNSGGAAGTFADKNVGPLKAVTVTGFTISGADAGNYTLTQPIGLQATIAVRPITVMAQTNNKVYDGTTSSAANPAISAGTLATGDTANFTQTYDTKNVGTSKILTPTGAVNDGNLGGNYSVTFANNGTGTITMRPITITADPKAKGLGAPDPALTYSVTPGSLIAPDTLSGSLTRASGEGAGTYAIFQGTVTAGPNYDLTYVGANLVIGVGAQAITVVIPAPATAAYNTSFSVTATASSGLPVAITTIGSTACTGSGSTTAIISISSGTGTCTVHYNQAGDANFNAATPINQTVGPQKADQTILVNAPAVGTTAVYNTSFNAAANATSTLTVAYTSAGSCSNAGANFTMTSGTGNCTVTYNQPGDNNYNAAPPATRTVAAQKANQTITVTTNAPGSAAYGSNFTVAATAPGGAVTYSAAGSCTNAGATFTMTSGTVACTVQYNQPGNANYNAVAPQVTQTVNATKAALTITASSNTMAFGSPVPTITPIYTGFVGGDNASVLTTAPTCVTAATSASPAGPYASSCSGAVAANYNITYIPGVVTVNAAGGATVSVTGGTFTYDGNTHGATGFAYGIGGVGDVQAPAVTFSYSGTGATVYGPTAVAPTNAGTYNVTASFAGNANYSAVSNTATITINKRNVTVTANAQSKALGNPDPALTYTNTALIGTDSVTGALTRVAGETTGSYAIQQGSVSAGPNYNIVYVGANLTIGLAGQTINVTTHAPSIATNGATFTVVATASSGLPVAITTSGDCSGSGSGSALITITAASGTCDVRYDQAGDGTTIAAAPRITDTVTIDSNAPTVTVNQAAAQIDPTNGAQINFTVVFSEAVTGFASGDIAISGTAGATTATITGAGPTYNVAISGMANDGTVIISIPAGAVTDVSNNANAASTSTDNAVTYFDGVGPNVQVINTSPETADQVLSNAEEVAFNISQFTVKFNQDVYNPAGDSDPDDVTNPNNYLLIRDLGDTAGLQTASCVTGAVVPADTKITTNTVTYDSATNTATFTVNSGLPLSNGDYHLFICGTTSIVDPLNNALALVGSNGAGSDFRRSFTVSITNNGGGGNNNGGGSNNSNNNGSSKNSSSSASTNASLIPVTGFSPNRVTILPKQPADKTYKSLDDIRIEIPTLGISFPIVGVPETDNGWNLTWLKNNVGYLESSAYPTFDGNTVLTAHVRDANKNIGPFSDIKGMKLGDRILIHAYGKIYVYEVQENKKISSTDIATAFKHEEYAWITLVTCEDYNAKIEEYSHRRMVRAVLISVVPEP